MAFGTHKPCHGCGQEGYRAVDEVCSECKALLRVGRAVKQEDEAKAEARKLFRLTQEWPGFYIPSGDQAAGRNLRKAFEELARAALRPVRSRKDPYTEDVQSLPPTSDLCHYFSTHDPKATVWTGTARLAGAITDLDDQVRKALALSRQIGEQEGSNLLLQIAQGKLSVNDLTKASIEAGRAAERGKE
jgi:hypothetical protein